jgi:hypothetical protein
MKALIVLFVAMMPLAAADKPAEKKPATATKAAAQPTQIPAGAVETDPGTFRYTDAQGKKWLYRKTPFGVAKIEDSGDAAKPAAPVAPAADAKVTVEDRGDSVHFERPGPFGMYRWDRKKTDLTTEERGWLDKSRAATQAKTN